ncbi:hypothetical protein HY989_05410 [Candidatus Micrarchaeota archaeon]|nr:hypothetical protein [Candidatus Micrarchaeota archaeon]
MKIIILGLVLFFSMQLISAASEKTAIIYKNEACGHCTPYLEKLLPLLEQKGYAPIVKDFINSQEARRELSELQQKFNVPLQYQGHMLVYIDGKYLFEGHVPVQVVEKYLSTPIEIPVILFQDSMGEAKTYFQIKDGKAVEYLVDDASKILADHLANQIETAGISSQTQLPNWFFPLMIFAIPLGLLVKYGR